MTWLLACSNQLWLASELPVEVGRISTALFVESAYSNPPDDGYGLLLLSSGGVSCEDLMEVDAYGVEWLGEQGRFTARQSGLLVSLRWIEMGWEGAYPVGGTVNTETGVRTATLYAYQDGELFELSSDSGALYIDALRSASVEGRLDTRQVQGRFRTDNCGQAPPGGYYTE